MSNSVCGRFAPSPSGRMHIGNAFCALLSWLAAKSAGGKTILRIEDLDTARCKPVYTAQLIDDLNFLGLEFDEGPQDGANYLQSHRTALYEHALNTLEKKGLVYPCYCSRDELHAVNAPHASDGRVLYSGTCRDLTEEERASKTRSPAIRMKAGGVYSWQDGVYGYRESNVGEEWGDFVLRRSDGLFAYQLAVVVDDAAMGVTQVVRGRDLLLSVAPQLYLYDALDLQAPIFYHIPLLLAQDGRRLSKRDRDLDIGELRKYYTTPEPLIGMLLYLAGLIERSEPLSAKEAISCFSFESLKKDDIIVSNADFFA